MLSLRGNSVAKGKSSRMKLCLALTILSFYLSTISGTRHDIMCQNGYLDSYPFFGDDSETPMRFKAQQMAFLIEFSRFMNLRAPMMLKVRQVMRREKQVKGQVLFKDFVNEKKVHQAHVALTRLRKEADDVESQDDNGVDRDGTRHLQPEIAESGDGSSFGTDGDDQAIDIAQMLMETIKNVQDVSQPR